MVIKCCHDDAVIPPEDVPYILIEQKNGLFKYTCIKHMTEAEQFERFKEIMEYF